MTLTLPKAQERVVNRLVRSGKFPNSQAVLREAIKRLARDPEGYLNPPPLTKAQIEEIYGPDPEQEEREARMGQVSFQAVRRLARTHPQE